MGKKKVVISLLIIFGVIILAIFYKMGAGSTGYASLRADDAKPKIVSENGVHNFETGLGGYAVKGGRLKVLYNLQDTSGKDSFINFSYILSDGQDKISNGERTLFLSANQKLPYVFELLIPTSGVYSLESRLTDGVLIESFSLANISPSQSALTGYAAYPVVLAGSRTAFIIALFVCGIYLASRHYTRKRAAKHLSSSVQGRYIKLKLNH